MADDNPKYTAQRFFLAVTAHPKSVIAGSLLTIAVFLAFLPSLEKDISSDAFMSKGHPALVFRNKTRDIFGLGDPMVIALVNKGENGVFNPASLALLQWLSLELESIDNIDPEGIKSLATENNIVGSQGGMEIEPFLEPIPASLTEARAIKNAVMKFPLYVGSLVAEDGSGTLIVAELIDETLAQQTYRDLLKLVARAPLGPDDELHIAGEGALTGYFGDYIDADASRLNPICALLIAVLCYIAFRTLRAIFIPYFVVLATVAGALGLMAAFDVAFFIITNALPVILIGIAVADSIHILTEYYALAAARPNASSRELSVAAMTSIWRAITLTSLTTMAGFVGLAVATIMPPMMYFGLFALIGVGIAWLFSLTAVPALLCLLKPQSSDAYRTAATATSALNAQANLRPNQLDIFGKSVQSLGSVVIRFPVFFVACATSVAIAGFHGASKIYVDETITRAFDPSEPIIIANDTINASFDGTYFFDIMIETKENEALFKPENLQKMEQLQQFLERHPNVKGTSSIVDYLKQMHRAMNADAPEYYRLPDQEELIAQYFFLYSTSAGPTDFEEEVDYDYRLANIRVNLMRDQFTYVKPVMEDLHQYIQTHFPGDAIKAHPTGRTNVNYHWMKQLGDSHFISVAVTLCLVFLMAAVSFRSLVAGLFCLAPVAVTVLGIYAYMGYSGLWLSINSSMFASIAIGLGVDFSIHTVERIQTAVRSAGLVSDEALLSVYRTTGRALLFNFLALAIGFGTVSFSKVVILQEFGSSIALSMTISFFASLTLLPALAKKIQPKFLLPDHSDPSPRR